MVITMSHEYTSLLDTSNKETKKNFSETRKLF